MSKKQKMPMQDMGDDMQAVKGAKMMDNENMPMEGMHDPAEDVHTLLSAEEIKASPGRHHAALQHGKRVISKPMKSIADIEAERNRLAMKSNKRGKHMMPNTEE